MARFIGLLPESAIVLDAGFGAGESFIPYFLSRGLNEADVILGSRFLCQFQLEFDLPASTVTFIPRAFPCLDERTPRQVYG